MAQKKDNQKNNTAQIIKDLKTERSIKTTKIDTRAFWTLIACISTIAITAKTFNDVNTNIDAANDHLSDGGAHYERVNRRAQKKVLQQSLAKNAFSIVGMATEIEAFPDNITIDTKDIKIAAQEAGNRAEQEAREEDQRYAEKSVLRAAWENKKLGVIGAGTLCFLMVSGLISTISSIRKIKKIDNKIEALKQNTP